MTASLHARASSDDLLITGFGDAWFRGKRAPCALGRGGRRWAKREGDGATPLGRFAIEFGLYRPDRLAAPRSAIPFRPIRLWDGWSDAPKDPAYNQPVRRPHPHSHERLWRADPLYDVILVMTANRAPIIPNNGSALFIHLWRGPRRPTEGCIALRRSDLLWILARWSDRSRILIR
ncbi:MAG: L,D-transpeptidase family protein [Pseudomonadota bacterium]